MLTVSSKTFADRFQELNNTILAEHLTEEEREHVVDFINSNYDLFHLPGCALGKTKPSHITSRPSTTYPFTLNSNDIRRFTGKKSIRK